jgi:hypothetical protein
MFDDMEKPGHPKVVLPLPRHNLGSPLQNEESIDPKEKSKKTASPKMVRIKPPQIGFPCKHLQQGVMQ